MRDILSDLEERLAKNKAEQDRLRKRFEADISKLTAEAETITHMIDIESEGQGDLGLGRVRVRLTSRNITDFILDKLADGKVWTTSSLRDEALAAGLLKDGSSPGRSTHGSLLSLLKAKKVEYVPKAQWRIAA